MPPSSFHHLSKRERQIMESVYRRGRATALEIAEDLPEAPTGGAVRTLIRILERKGHLTHIKEGVRHIYLPNEHPRTARRSALNRVIDTFFGGSAGQTVSTLISDADTHLSEEDLERISQLIEARRHQNRRKTRRHSN